MLSEKKIKLNKNLSQELVTPNQLGPVIMDTHSVGSFEWDIKNNSISVDASLKNMLGYGDHELTNSRSIWEALKYPQNQTTLPNLFEEHLNRADDFSPQIETMFQHRDGSLLLIRCWRKIIEWDENYGPAIMVGLCLNIVFHSRLEQSLASARAELRRKNIALQEVIAGVEHEKNKVKKIVYDKLSYGLSPIISRLKKNKSGLDLLLLEMIENVIEAAGEELFSRQDKVVLKLSPREIQICLLVKNGLSVKEIAQFYNLSQRTIDKHRENIRKKLGLHGSAVNLVSFLRDLEL